MEKLIELLEIFEKENVEKLKSDVWENGTISPRVWSESDIIIYNKLQVISKEFGFINWLVDNDKIDTKKVAERRKEDGWSIVNYNHYEEQMTRDIRVEYWVDNTLMALSISDTPIADLISYLK